MLSVFIPVALLQERQAIKNQLLIQSHMSLSTSMGSGSGDIVPMSSLSSSVCSTGTPDSAASIETNSLSLSQSRSGGEGEGQMQGLQQTTCDNESLRDAAAVTAVAAAALAGVECQQNPSRVNCLDKLHASDNTNTDDVTMIAK